MNKFKTLLFLAVFSGIGLWGCDDSSSASDDNNGTSAVESSSSMSTDKEKSSDSKTKQSNSSGEEQNSSNTEKMSSSSQKNSSKSNSSSSANENESSASSSGSCKNGETRESDVLGVAIQYDHCENGRWVIDSTVIVVDTSIHYTFHPNLDSVFNPDVEYGEFKDKRDGNVYKTITFVDGYGDTRTMFAQNLNYGTFVKLGENSDAEVQKHCYDDDEWYCDHYFGGLYTWSETFGFPRACDTIPVGTSPACPDTVWYDPDPDVNNDGWKSIIHKQGICPDGWHILTYDEWNAAIGQTVLWRALSKASWWYENGATNQAGISLLATGYIDEKTFKYRGEQTEFWYSVHAGYGVDMLGTDKAKGFRIYTDEKYIKTATLTKVAYYPKKTAFPIRCVMDKE
ncbi:MAG: hypothetical protein IKP02_08525 [Paludibacteraceae bacterium]|nr:hypothetical protein [Fibrobacter sp.]MBR4705620.1 hypothetical protein [Paludibacteraceae bacterium]MBR6124979.1 hypothetical protein [Candidatus Saccharibacteria bacterium]MBR6125945.1 hypothetical protein [Candidatus Saccharibacteria bacterium]